MTDVTGQESEKAGKNVSRRPELRTPSDVLAEDEGLSAAVAAREVKTQIKTSRQVHAFQVGSLGILLPKNTIAELVEGLSICKIPNTSPILHGVGSLRGVIVPVFNLQKLFGLDESECNYILVIGSGDKSVGVLINKLPQQIDVGENNQYNNIPPLPEVFRPYAQAAYQNEGLWIESRIFDFFKSLNSKVA